MPKTKSTDGVGIWAEIALDSQCCSGGGADPPVHTLLGRQRCLSPDAPARAKNPKYQAQKDEDADNQNNDETPCHRIRRIVATTIHTGAVRLGIKSPKSERHDKCRPARRFNHIPVTGGDASFLIFAMSPGHPARNPSSTAKLRRAWAERSPPPRAPPRIGPGEKSVPQRSTYRPP